MRGAPGPRRGEQTHGPDGFWGGMFHVPKDPLVDGGVELYVQHSLFSKTSNAFEVVPENTIIAYILLLL